MNYCDLAFGATVSTQGRRIRPTLYSFQGMFIAASAHVCGINRAQDQGIVGHNKVAVSFGPVMLHEYPFTRDTENG